MNVSLYGTKIKLPQDSLLCLIRNESAPDTHKHRNPGFKSLSHLVLEHFALRLVYKFAHLVNKDFLAVFF